MASKRRTPGEYWLTQRSDSPYWYLTTYDPITGKSISRSTRTTEKVAAEKMLARVVLGYDELHTKTNPATQGPIIAFESDMVSLKQVMDEYLVAIARQPSAEQARYTSRHLTDFFGEDVDVETLGFDAQESYLDARYNQGVMASTIERELSVLRAALRHYSDVFPHRLPLAPKVYYTEREDNSRKRWLTREEFALLLNAAKSPHIRLFILLGIATGARPEAILDLKWAAIDFNAKRIYLNPNGRVQNSKHRPVVPLLDELWEELARAKHIEQSVAQARRSVRKGRPTCEYVISFGGYPVNSIKKAFARLVRSVGLKDVVPYTLRHTAASWLAQAGVPLVEIAAFLGHKDIRMVERHYIHLHPDHQVKVANIIGENIRLAGISPQFHPRLRNWNEGDIAKSLKAMVGVTGIEPVTPSMSTKCSPAELHAHCHAEAGKNSRPEEDRITGL